MRRVVDIRPSGCVAWLVEDWQSLLLLLLVVAEEAVVLAAYPVVSAV